MAVAGGMAVQNSILIWAARHRVHHRSVDDDDKDPYSIGRGFWYAHVGWMLRDYRSGQVDYKIVPDLKKNKIVMWQHKHYLELVLLTNVGLPMLLGWMVGDFWGVFLLAGLGRLVLNHHFTFFIMKRHILVMAVIIKVFNLQCKLNNPHQGQLKILLMILAYLIYMLNCQYLLLRILLQ